MAKKELLLGAVAAGLLLSGVAAPAFAAKGEGKHQQRHAAMIERLDADKNGKVSLDEFKANISTAFKIFDTDGNGEVTKDEIKARHAAFKDARKAVRDAADADKDKAREALRASGPYWMPGAGKMFERADADKNGTVTKAEMETAAAAMFKQRDRNGDGFITVDEIGKRHKK